MSLSIEQQRTLISSSERRRLQWSFEMDQIDYAAIPNTDTYIGVHLDKLDGVMILQQEGKWFIMRKIIQRGSL